MHTEWEYKIISSWEWPKPGAKQVEYEARVDHLNKLGKDGWELVTIINLGALYEAVLKRPILKDPYYVAPKEES